MFEHTTSKQTIIRIATVVVLIVVYASCRVTMVAPYEEKVVQQIQQVAKKVDRLYLTILETGMNDSSKREYALFAKDYVDIEVDLNSLLNQNRMKALNRESTRNCEIALETWVKYKEKHKRDNGISDVDIELNRDYYRDLFMVIQMGEEAKLKVR